MKKQMFRLAASVFVDAGMNCLSGCGAAKDLDLPEQQKIETH